MSKKILVASFATALTSFATEVREKITAVKTAAGSLAFDILAGGATDSGTEVKIAEAKTEVNTLEYALGTIEGLLATFGVDGAIPLVISGELEDISITKPKNVPTLTISTFRDLHLIEGKNAFVQTKEGEFYVLIQSVSSVEGNGEVSTEYTYVTKILATLTAGYVEATKATTTGRTSARKPATSNKPASKKPAAKKPAAKDADKKTEPARSRRPRPNTTKKEEAPKNSEAATQGTSES
ncbi:hypothetical protein [Vibrio phage R01]|nr:hypothetical protein [Vibrio phage R01]